MKLDALIAKVWQIPELRDFPDTEIQAELNTTQSEICREVRIPRKIYGNVNATAPFNLVDAQNNTILRILEMRTESNSADDSKPVKLISPQFANQLMTYDQWTNNTADHKYQNYAVIDDGNPTLAIYPVGIETNEVLITAMLEPLPMDIMADLPFCVFDRSNNKVSMLREYHIAVAYGTISTLLTNIKLGDDPRTLNNFARYRDAVNKMYTFSHPDMFVPSSDNLTKTNSKARFC
jgi:hypothetical protein